MATAADLRDAADNAITSLLAGAQSVTLPNGYSYTRTDLDKLRAARDQFARQARRRGGRIALRGASW